MRDLSKEEMILVAGGLGEPPLEGPCNNGWGNGESCAPGRSLAAQAKFQSPDTTTSPSSSAASGGGNR